MYKVAIPRVCYEYTLPKQWYTKNEWRPLSAVNDRGTNQTGMTSNCERGEYANRTKVISRMKSNKHNTRDLARLQVVRGDKTRPAIFTHCLCLPPSIVLESKNSKNVALLERKFFRDLCCVCIHGTSYECCQYCKKWLLHRQLTVVQNDASVSIVIFGLCQALAAYSGFSSY